MRKATAAQDISTDNIQTAHKQRAQFISLYSCVTSQMLCLLPCHYPACCSSDESLLQEHVSACWTPCSLPRPIYFPRQLCLQVQNFFSQDKTSMVRHSNFAVCMNAKRSDQIMTCVYVRQAFNQNKPFRHAKSCLIFFFGGGVKGKRSCTSACAVNKRAVAARLQILLLNSSAHISFSFSFVSNFSPYLCKFFCFLNNILKWTYSVLSRPYTCFCCVTLM